MHVIITGSRSIQDPVIVERAIAGFGERVTTVVTGGDKGVESMACDWADRNKVPIELYRPNFRYHCESAQRKQTDIMIRISEGLIVVWDGKPKRIKRLLRIARAEGLRVHEVKIDIPDTF